MSALKIIIGSDHAGFKTKDKLVGMLKKTGYSVQDVGTRSEDSCDYPDFAVKVGKLVANKKQARGILLCGTGIGMCIAANKVRGVRAASVWNTDVAQLAAEHNWANIVCLPSRFLPVNQLFKIIQKWLQTPRDLNERHQRRVAKIAEIERKN